MAVIQSLSQDGPVHPGEGRGPATAAMIVVEPVTSRQQLKAFIDLPPAIYSGFREYHPPLRFERMLALDDRRSPFWQQGNRCCYWLARKEGRVVGRISAQIGQVTPVGIAAGSGMFGCLDAIDDAAVIEALLEAARAWLRQQGCGAMFGPCALDFNMEPGLLVEGIDQPPMMMSPWHPPYLGRHLERLGLGKLHDLHYWRIDLHLAPGRARDALLRQSRDIPGLRIRYPDKSSYDADIAILCDIYNDGWRGNWGHLPLTPGDLDGLDLLMRWKVPRRAFKIVELNGTPVAVMLLVPNLFEWFAGLAPRPGPLGWLRLLWRVLTHRFRSGRFIVTGMTSDMQGSVTGAAIMARLIDETIADCMQLRGEWAEAGWILESNTRVVRILERFGFRRNKTFRIFGQNLVSGSGNPNSGDRQHER